MKEFFGDLASMVLLVGAIGFGGYAFGTPGNQMLTAGLCGLCCSLFVTSIRRR